MVREREASMAKERKPMRSARTRQPTTKPSTVAMSHENEELPPARAAAQAKREADLEHMITTGLVDRLASKKKPAP